MRYGLLPVLVVVAGLVATTIVSLVLRNQIQHREQDDLQAATEAAAEQIKARFNLYAEELFDVRPMFEGDPHRTTRAEFQSWVQVSGVFERLAGIQALSFVRVVASQDRGTFEAAVRQDTSANGIGYPEFEVHPDSEASHLFVVDFIEPMEGNEAAFGFDLGTNSDRLAAVETAWDTGDLTATAPITLAQETEDQKGILLLLGVYDTPLVPTTEEVRRSSFTGLISAVFRIDDMLAGALGDDPQVILEIYDVGQSDAEPLQPAEAGLLSDSDPSARTALEADNSPDAATTEISIGGRRWLLVAEPTPALGLGQDVTQWIAIAVGITLALLLGGLVASLTYGRRRAEDLVEIRTAELQRSEHRLQHDALHDPLTGLPNRRHFLREAEQAFRERALDRDAGFCVLFLDLDGFKIVNDSLGHAAGDALISQVAARLKMSIRGGGRRYPADPRGTASLLARMGGDEFTVLARGVRSHEEATAIAERIQAVLRGPFRVEGQEVVTSASIGIALSSSEHVSADELVHHADLAMYHAKAHGKARSEFYDAAMQALATHRLSLNSELQAAVRDEAFELHYQPIVSLDDGEVVGVEALLRWRVSPTSLRYPDEFIPAAEEIGLIVPIGLWVLREACRAVARWNAARQHKRPLTVSVNLSPRQFVQPDLVERVGSILAETRVGPELVRFEITEAVAMDDAEQAIEVLDRLRALGIQIGIDDFGTGFSCLSYLPRYPVQVLKIDRSFISRMETNMESLQIVKTIAVLARSLGMEVIAEGAENAEAIVLLRSLGCDFCQGNYFSPPLPADELEAFLERPPQLLPVTTTSERLWNWASGGAALHGQRGPGLAP